MKSKNLKKSAKNQSKSPKSSNASSVAGKKRAIFQVKSNPDSEVFLVGSFNSWKEKGKKMVDKKGNGEYSAMVYLPKGDYEYKYVINSEWHVDPNAPDGSKTNLVR